MPILHLVAGAGSMYCGSCLHGNTLARALRELGEDVLLVPLYTPLRTDEPSAIADHLAYGGINVYLQQKSALFRRVPSFLAAWLDHPWLVSRLSMLSAGVKPESLGPLLVSVLQGRDGRQRRELDKLVDWLQREVRPDLVHLSNGMLAGLADEIARRLGVPVLATLSGEDGFIEKTVEPFRTQARELLGRCCAGLAGLAATNEAYAAHFAEYASIPRERIRVIRPGLSLADFPITPRSAWRPCLQRPFTVGYFGRVCADKGVHVLLEAVGHLRDRPGTPPIRLLVGGYLDPGDRAYLERLRRKAVELGLADCFELRGECSRSEKIAFLRSLDVYCAPSLFLESKALGVLEAWAAGVPAVLPGWATFAELAAETGGGLLYEPRSCRSLAESLRRLIDEPELAEECGRRAQRAIHERYTAERMARQTQAWYEELRGRGNDGGRNPNDREMPTAH